MKTRIYWSPCAINRIHTSVYVKALVTRKLHKIKVRATVLR